MNISRKQDAIDAIHCDIKITGRENAETVCKTIESFTDGIKSLHAADVISKADMITLLEETEKDITKGVETSPTGIMINSVFGIIKCKVNMIGEKSNE